MDRIQELKEKITYFDSKYRVGDEVVSDPIYENAVDELKSLIGDNDPFFKSSIKTDTVPNARKAKLPIRMASMEKCKTLEEIQKWKVKYHLENEYVILTSKYDGISLAKDESYIQTYTRGQEENVGMLCNDHLAYMNDPRYPQFNYTYGEAIITRENFEHIKDNFDGNSTRNAVSGIFRRDYVSEELAYCTFVRYGAVGYSDDITTKSELLDELNSIQDFKVPYKKVMFKDLTVEYLTELFKEWAAITEIDGIIIELDDLNKQKELGREINGNPKYAVAFKGNFEEVKETTIREIKLQISKKGYAIPVAIFDPIMLDNALVERATLNNFEYLEALKIGVGSRVKVKRSGMVIPLITEVITEMPVAYPDFEYTREGVHLKVVGECDEQIIKKNLHFFVTIGVENVSLRTIEKLYMNGFKTIEDILNITIDDLLQIDGYKIRKAEQIYNSINAKVNDIPLCVLQHASSMFDNLGSKKLKMLEGFETCPTVEQVCELEGFSEISATTYCENYDSFFDYIKTLPITYKLSENKEATGDLAGKKFLFSGFRDKDLQNQIEDMGGEIVNSYSKKVDVLIVKDVNGKSSKISKAKEDGAEILDKDMFNETYM